MLELDKQVWTVCILIVDNTNLGHQRFSLADVGLTKVEVLSSRFDLIVYQLPLNLSQLDGYDLIIVAVDRMEPRQLVQ